MVQEFCSELTGVIHRPSDIPYPPTNRSTASINWPGHGQSPISNGLAGSIKFAYITLLVTGPNRELHNLAKHIQAGQRENDTVCKAIFRSWPGTGVCVCRCVWVMLPAGSLARGPGHKSESVISIAMKLAPGSQGWHQRGRVMFLCASHWLTCLHSHTTHTRTHTADRAGTWYLMRHVIWDGVGEGIPYTGGREKR